MTYMTVIRCNSCSASSECTPDEGAPEGWFNVAKMTQQGGWDDNNEWHFCNVQCLSAGVRELL